MDTGLDTLRIPSKKLVHKAAKVRGDFIGDNTADKIVKAKHVIDENQGNVEEIITLAEKREEEILNELRQA